MLEKWVALKILFDYIIPFIIFGIIIIICIILILKAFILEKIYNKKIELLIKERYERYLIRVASMGSGAWYGWKNDAYNHRITEEELNKISFQDLKKEIECVKRTRLQTN